MWLALGIPVLIMLLALAMESVEAHVGPDARRRRGTRSGVNR
jgi:hypothetical protein